MSTLICGFLMYCKILNFPFCLFFPSLPKCQQRLLPSSLPYSSLKAVSFKNCTFKSSVSLKKLLLGIPPLQSHILVPCSLIFQDTFSVILDLFCAQSFCCSFRSALSPFPSSFLSISWKISMSVFFLVTKPSHGSMKNHAEIL